MLALKKIIKKVFFTAIHKYVLLCLLFFSSHNVFADITLQKVDINEDEVVLANVILNKGILINALDGYVVNGNLLLAVEPLFDALTLRYQLYDDHLIVWKDDEEITLTLSKSHHITQNNSEIISWASDDFYVYVNIETISSIFGVTITYNPFHMAANIVTTDYIFPKQKLELQAETRQLSRINYNRGAQERQAPVITIPDQYRLLTVPHGQINTAVSWNNNKRDNNLSLQLTSDLLYHSANLTMSKANDTDLISRMQLSRYKTTPDELILGAFDKYSFGDVSGFSTKLTNTTNSGLGITFNRAPNNFRHQNQSITLKYTAPPGWEAELYHNNRFIKATNVPNDGLLIFDDVNTEYGQNHYQLKLYSPFGEEKIIEEYVDLTKNSLSQGDFAYSLFAFDKNHQLLSDSGDEGYGITDLGATLDYGISDNWQLGVSYSISDEEVDIDSQQLNIKNALSFPGLLFENNISIDEDSGVAQNSTIIGNGFGSDRIALNYLSAYNFDSSRIQAKEYDFHQVSASYSGYFSRINYLFGAKYLNALGKENWGVSNRLSTSIKDLYISNTLNYTFDDNRGANNQSNEFKKDKLLGELGIGGRITDSIRLSGQINYSPLDSEFIQKNSSIQLQWKLKDPFGADHYITGRYNPLVDSDNKWSLNHNVALTNKNYSLTLTANYNAQDNWSFQAGIRFFLGYDYYNNRPIFSSEISGRSATLNAHTYLDRQLNGIPDPLDFNLAKVSFQGNQAWENISSGATGKTILPGIIPNGAFRFGAKWQVGSETINNDYVVYTHPGAYVDANIPFYLSTEFTGFVVREKGGQETPLSNVLVELVDNNDTVVKTTQTDIDGYYEFIKLPPQLYFVRVAKSYIRDKGYTSNVIGFELPMLRSGGFVELDTISLIRQPNDDYLEKEELKVFTYTSDNSEAIVWDDDQKIRQDYFLLPSEKVSTAQHTLSAQTTESAIDTHSKEQLIEDKDKATEQVDKNAMLLSYLSSQDKKLITFSSVDTQTNNSHNNPNVNQIESTTNVLNTNKDITFYTIQLGAFNTINDAKELISTLPKNINSEAILLEEFTPSNNKLFKVTLGRFPSKKQALDKAKSSLPTYQSYYVKTIKAQKNSPIEIKKEANESNNVVANKTGWVIQFYAGEEPIQQDIITKYNHYDELFLAEKSNGKTNVLFCLVSKVFKNKNDALNALSQKGISGWVTKASPYLIKSKLG